MNEFVPRIIFQDEMARQERYVKRLWILCIILVILLVTTNGLWIWYESQFQVVEETKVEQEVDTGNGDTNVVGIGDINYGESKTESYQD